MPVAVSQLAFVPVKGMRLQCVSELELGPLGVAGDRDFLVVDDRGKLLLTARHPALLRIEPCWAPHQNLLAFRFPDGRVVQDEPGPGTAAVTRTYDGRELRGQVVPPGPLSAALSDYLDRPVRLFRRAPDELGADDCPVTLMSQSSLHALAAELGGAEPDPRRFRMSLTITGVEPWAEHGWGEQPVRIGDTTLRVLEPVPRCVITTRNPDSGATDARILHALARLRGKTDLTFGVWCDVLRPGRIHVGDPVTPP
jgi:uncharacterized protein YcbX